MHRNVDWLPALKWILLGGTIVGAVLVLLGGQNRFRKLAVAGVIVGSIAGIGGSASYAIATAATAHGGSIPSAGPSGAVTDSGMGSGGGMGGGGNMPGDGGATTPDTGAGGTTATGSPPAADAQAASGAATTDGTAPTSGASPAGGGTGGGGANTELTTLLETAGTTWSAATNGSQSAATYELSSNTSVMAIGGWSGDPTPTLDQFKAYVESGKVHYYIAGGMGGGGGGSSSSSTSSEISAWVAANFTATTVGNTTVYDLSTG